MFRWDASGAIARVTAPVLVVGGRWDIVTKPEASRYIASSASDSKLAIIEGVNHMGFLERYEDYSELIAGFADGVKSPAAVRPLDPAPN
jgi:pimeloyl-ACP methyl ester carboxylesterase